MEGETGEGYVELDGRVGRVEGGAQISFWPLENGQMHVVETRIPAGHIVPVHTHRWPGVHYILSSSDFVRRDGEGRVLLDTRGRGNAVEHCVAWTGPLGLHSVENVGGARAASRNESGMEGG